MDPLAEILSEELSRWESAGLLRRLEAEQTGLVDLASNDYLGLARHPEVIEAARAALERFGAGARASRLLGGGSPMHEEAERAIAEWLGAEAALLFASGYQANLGLVGALIGRGDAVFSDERNHASLVDAARLSRARVFVHRHLDLEELEAALARAKAARRRLVLTEGVFSMDGDAPPLERLAALCERHDAWLAVDEAHSAGLVGPEGAGAWAASRCRSPALAARVVTGGKALGASGAFVIGSAKLREHLVNHARSFMFSTAPPPAVAGALLAAVRIARGAEEERARALALARDLAQRLGLPVPAGAIVPFVVGDSTRALELAQELRKQGLDVRAVRSPSVPEGGARLRIVLHAYNTEAECDELARGLAGVRLPADSRAPAKLALRRALFVVGTDTGVGKTVVSALLLRAARKLAAAAYWKPVQTGGESDTETVRRLADALPHECLRPAWLLDHPASPHEAASRAGHAIEPKRLEEGLQGLLRTLPDTRLVVELAGGLLVPYAIEPALATQADWLERAAPPVVLVARAGLGTLNHTLLTLEALRARHLEPRALFLVGDAHEWNRDTLERIAGVPRIFEVPLFSTLEPAALEAWLERNELRELFDP